MMTKSGIGLALSLAGVMVLMFAFALISSCNLFNTTTSPTKQEVMTYEDVGVALATAQNILHSYELQGIIKGDDLIRAKLLYSQARSAYIEAGDNIVLMIQTADANQQVLQRRLYAKALAKAAQLAIQLTALFKRQ